MVPKFAFSNSNLYRLQRGAPEYLAPECVEGVGHNQVGLYKLNPVDP
jgi:hypothetical protein